MAKANSLVLSRNKGKGRGKVSREIKDKNKAVTSNRTGLDHREKVSRKGSQRNPGRRGREVDSQSREVQISSKVTGKTAPSSKGTLTSKASRKAKANSRGNPGNNSPKILTNKVRTSKGPKVSSRETSKVASNSLRATNHRATRSNKIADHDRTGRRAITTAHPPKIAIQLRQLRRRNRILTSI